MQRKVFLMKTDRPESAARLSRPHSIAWWLIAAAIGLCAIPSTHATTMTLQYSANGSGYQSEVDGTSGTYYGWQTWAGGAYGALADASGSQSTILMKFANGNGTGIGTIPSGATVSSATLIDC